MPYRRTPKGFNGIGKTSKRLSEVIPFAVEKCKQNGSQSGLDLLNIWPEIVGEKIASMSKATAFKEGILYVQVTNSSLYSLLMNHEKPRLLAELKRRFSYVRIKNLVFRLG